MSNKVEGPRDRGPQGMSAWHRIVAEDGSTIAYAPDVVTANKIAVVDELYEACKTVEGLLNGLDSASLAAQAEPRFKNYINLLRDVLAKVEKGE